MNYTPHTMLAATGMGAGLMFGFLGALVAIIAGFAILIATGRA